MPFPLISDSKASVILAPMEGVTDAPMRAFQTEFGYFTHCVSEFIRISDLIPPTRLFHSMVPELKEGAHTRSQVPVQVQLLGGNPEKLAHSAQKAVASGATAIDLNFGCPAPTVNRHDGGSTLLKTPERIHNIVKAVRSALPREIPVSAKLRLGWDSIDILRTAEAAEKGGASWIAIHGRTRMQAYRPPALWHPIGEVRKALSIPVIANGDIWTLDDFKRCREETGCTHFMLGRGILANPNLSLQIARELGLSIRESQPLDWSSCINRYKNLSSLSISHRYISVAGRIKQWLRIAAQRDTFSHFDKIKLARTVEELQAAISLFT